MPKDPLDFHAIDHVEFYVSNARQAAHFYRTTLGLQPRAYAGLETGVRDRASWMLECGHVRFVLTSPIQPDLHQDISQHIAKHGDGVRDIALRVLDAKAAYEEAMRRGATSVAEPTAFEDGNGRFVRASIATYGDTIHSFIERENYQGFMPGFRPIENPLADHVGRNRPDQQDRYPGDEGPRQLQRPRGQLDCERAYVQHRR